MRHAINNFEACLDLSKPPKITGNYSSLNKVSFVPFRSRRSLVSCFLCHSLGRDVEGRKYPVGILSGGPQTSPGMIGDH